MNPELVMQVFTSLTTLIKDGIEICEKEKTNREKIRTDMKMTIKQFEIQKELFKDYYTKVFKEREFQFSKYFEQVDKAMENGDVQALGLILHNINELAQHSPLARFTDIKQTQEFLSSNEVIDI